MDFIHTLFSTDGFMPHGHCYQWIPSLLALHIISDSLIAISYFTIPFTLVYFVRRQKEIPFSWMFVCFAAFIIACGATHVMEVWTVWHPNYWLTGLVKAITALASVPTAVLLIRLVPFALLVPTPSALTRAKEEAEKELFERKKMEQALHEQNFQLLEASDTKNRFLANMSHELRTPLNGIIGFTELLVDGRPGPINEKQKEYLQDILSGGRHLLQLINDVLDLARVEANKMEIVPENFFLEKAISEVCSVAKPIADHKNIQVRVEVADGLQEVTLDQQKFKQVLYNLLSNALKFSLASGKVNIRVEPSGQDSFTMSVQDYGIGIKEEDMPRLFQEFERLSNNPMASHEGTGLGLVLTKRIVELQGGNIEVQSEVGKGATFRVMLPRQMGERSD